MLRGVNRCIIEVNHPSSRYFEKAILFVKPQWSGLSETRLQDSARELFLDFETGAGNFAAPPCAAPRPEKRRLRKGRICKLVIATALLGIGVFCTVMLLHHAG